MLKPRELGLPDKFNSWRPGQEDIVAQMAYPEKWITVPVVPTGGGKTVCYVTAALMNPGRTLILTSTKGLQDQLMRDFPGIITVVKGRAAYRCRDSKEEFLCHTGSCRWGIECCFQRSGCHYFDAIRNARTAKIVVTNYAFWISNDAEMLGKFDLMICDEAHDAPDQLLGNLSMTIKPHEVSGIVPWPDRGGTTKAYIEWAQILRGDINDRVKKGKHTARGKMRYLTLLTKLQLLDQIYTNNWVVECSSGGLSFDAVWPSPLAGIYLFREVPRIVMTSAFITRADLMMLGIPDNKMTYTEYPSMFPVENRPVFFLPTIRLDRNSGQYGLNLWINRLDQIAKFYAKHNGIVHTGSYDRARIVRSASSFRGKIISGESGETEEVVSRFKHSEEPRVLVSPGVVTGYDFPGNEARWQVIGKVPFPDSRPLVVQVRHKMFKDYGCFVALKSLVQASGRIVRSPKDVGYTFIIDDHFQWVFAKYKDKLPKYWVEAVKRIDRLPEMKEE